MRALAAIALCLLLTGCPWSFVRPTAPVPAQCNQICFLPCTSADGDVGVRWEADPNDPAALDALGEEVVPALSGKLRQCEVKRQACTQCLQRLSEQKVIAL